MSQVLLFLVIVIMYCGLIPLMIPVFAIGLVFWYLCKKLIIIKFSVRVPANENLDWKIINIIPYIIVAHALFSLWSHTTPNRFAKGAPLISLNWVVFHNIVDRIFSDIIMLGELVVIVAVIVIDYTIVNLFGCLANCCKDELELPPSFKDLADKEYPDRVRKSNIVKSYKLINNPTYGLAMTNYNNLKFRLKMNNSQVNENQEKTLNPEEFS